MAISTKTLYQTEDGATFENELDAKAHEAALKSASEIEEFLDMAGIPKMNEKGRGNPFRTKARDLIAKWLAWKA